MSKSKKLHTINVVDEVYVKVKRKVEEKGGTLTDYVSETLLMNVEKDDFLKLYAPFLSLIGHHDNTLFIHDDKLNKNTEVTLKDRKLYCEIDSDMEICIHIAFALALPEVAKLKLDGKIKS